MEAKEYTIRLSTDTVQSVSDLMKITGEDEIPEAVANALRTYGHIAHLKKAGGEFFFRPEGEQVRRLNFLFEQQAEAEG